MLTSEQQRATSILVVEDDQDDRMMIEAAFHESRISNPRVYLGDGEELLDYLRGQGAWSSRTDLKLPGLILLDLNMPRMDGRTALEHLRADPILKRIPVVVLTTSRREEDVLGIYDLGVTSFVSKPVTYEGLIDVVRALSQYWIEVVALPGIDRSY